MAFNIFNKNQRSASDGFAAMPSSTAIIYRSEIDFISRCILDFPNIETGGELFGFWTPDGTPVVLYAVGPGPRAQHNLTSFVQDSSYVDNIEVKLCDRTRLQHIGQWHSHHQMDLAQPSHGDVRSMMRGVGLPGFPRMLLCIGNCEPPRTTVNAFNFHENTPGEYIHAYWDIVEMQSPYRAVVDSMFGGMLYSPRCQHAHHGEMHTTSTAAAPVESIKHHWLTECVENVEMMQRFLATAKSLFAGANPTAEILDSGEPMISLFGGDTKIMFPYGFPDKSPVYAIVDGKECSSNDSLNENAAVVWSEQDIPLKYRFNTWLRMTMPQRRQNDVHPEVVPPPIDKITPPDIHEQDNDYSATI